MKHTVTVRPTTVGDLRRGLARCPADARVTVTFSEVSATWTVEASAPSDAPAATS